MDLFKENVNGYSNRISLWTIFRNILLKNDKIINFLTVFIFLIKVVLKLYPIWFRVSFVKFFQIVLFEKVTVFAPYHSIQYPICSLPLNSKISLFSLWPTTHSLLFFSFHFLSTQHTHSSPSLSHRYTPHQHILHFSDKDHRKTSLEKLRLTHLYYLR